MLSLQPEFQQLSEEAKFRLSSFYRRFCQGENGKLYGLGHLIYASHAAFPLVVSPELANLIWLNFKNYYYTNGKDTGQCHMVAVSDFLLSPIVRKMGHQRYEVYPEIRCFLLLLLQDGKWLNGYGIKTEGKSRLNELAIFLKQFLSLKAPDDKYDGVGFHQLNQWAVAAWMDPQLLTKELANGFKQSTDTDNENAQLWLTLQMDKVGLQYGFNIKHSENRKTLSPFYRLYYYGKAREKQLYNQPAEAIYQYSGEISDFVETGNVNNELVVRLPLLKAVADRTDRKINKVQRVLSLLVGVDRNEERFPGALVSTYGISKLSRVLGNLNRNSNFDTGTIIELTSALASREGVIAELKKLLHLANPEDICFLYFAGFSREEPTGNDRLFVYPDQMTKMPQDYIDNNEILEMIQSAKKPGGPQIVFFRDVNETPYNMEIDHRDIMMGSTRPPEERHYDRAREEMNSSFNDALCAILLKMDYRITYGDLATFIAFKIENDYRLFNAGVVLKASQKNLDKYFLTNTSAPTGNYPLLAYNSITRCWQVLPGDFQLLPTNLPARVMDYHSHETITEHPAEIRVDQQNRIYQYFNKAFESQDKEKLFKLKAGLPPLYSTSTAISSIADAQSEKSIMAQLLSNHSGQSRPLWDKIEERDRNSLSFPGVDFHSNEINYYWADEYSSIHIYRKVRGRFEAVIQYGQGKKLLYSGEPEGIFRRINWFANNYQLLNARLPTIYSELEVLMDYYWQDKTGSNFSQYMHNALPVMKEGMYLQAGSIRFHPLGIQLTNNETFPVFYAAFFIGDDFTIKPIPEASGLLQPGEAKQFTHDITDLIIDLLEKNNGLAYKILFSRKPIQLPLQYLV